MTVWSDLITKRTMSPYCSLFSVTQYFGAELAGPAARMWFSDFRAGSQVMAEIIKGSL